MVKLVLLVIEEKVLKIELWFGSFREIVMKSSVGDINSYFEKCFHFGSLFILARSNEEERVVAEVKNINDGLEQLSFIPLNDEGFNFESGEVINFLNETGNISFEAEVIKNHASKWLTIKTPAKLRITNLRQSKRFKPDKKHLIPKPQVTSFGDDGLKKRASFEGELIDLSESGVSLLIKARRLDGLFRTDKVVLKLSSLHSHLSQLKGQVVHKSISKVMEGEDRVYKIGVQFASKINTSLLES